MQWLWFIVEDRIDYVHVSMALEITRGLRLVGGRKNPLFHESQETKRARHP